MDYKYWLKSRDHEYVCPVSDDGHIVLGFMFVGDPVSINKEAKVIGEFWEETDGIDYKLNANFVYGA